MRPLLVFHVDLLQDVAVVRPLVRLAARALPERDRLLLVSSGFAARDLDGTWARELNLLAADNGCRIESYVTPLDAWRLLASRHGLAIAGSESSVRSHAATHELFRALPPSFRTVTLQHGFECLGFLHNAAHDASVGPDIRFAADVIVGWFAAEKLVSIPAADRGKLFVAGPPSMIEPPAALATPDVASDVPGVICENLHSVRFAAAARSRFADVFADFMTRAAQIAEPVLLRPHPAGRFTKASASIGGTYERDTQPLYHRAIGQSAYAISAPSTILFDFVLADVPVALWAETGIDVSHFAGLVTVRGADDWWRFAQRARLDREAILAPQRRFAAGLRIPPDVPARYLRLMASD